MTRLLVCPRLALRLAAGMAVSILLVGCASRPGPLAAEGSPPRSASKLSFESFLLRLAQAPSESSAQEFLESACRDSFLAACDVLGKEVQYALTRIPVLQGATSATETELITLSEVPEPLYLLVWAESLRAPLQARDTTQVAVPDSTKQVTHYWLDGLRPGLVYKVQWTTRDGRLVDSRRFQLPNTAARKARIAVASCMDDSMQDIQKSQWQSLLSQEPDMLFLLGDTVYSDLRAGKNLGPSTVSQLWARHTETRLSLELFYAPRLVPVYAIWDDHDFGLNDGDETYPHRQTAREIFFTFFGSSTYPGTLERGPGVSFRLDAFGQMFFFLDNRSFRSVPEKPGGAALSHFGRDVEAWLFAALDGRTPTWILSGDQFFGGYHPFESFEGRHPKHFQKFTARLRSLSTPVAFISGDRHLSEIMKIDRREVGFETYEFTSSAIHAKTFADAFTKHPNPRQVAGKAGEPNFMTLEVSTEGKWEVRARAFGLNGRTLYRLTLYPADPATHL